MEATNICDINHLDGGDVLLPPRKRLLAGFKKQSSDANNNGNGGDMHLHLHPPTSVSSVASSSRSSSSSSSEFSSEFNARLSNLLKNNSNLSPEEIAELAKSAAVAAVKAAADARAVAEEKAAIATKAVTAAKSALDLVASFNEEAAASKDGYLKKNKMKKHVPVQLLYKKQQSVVNNKTDEELARRLHRVMNSSPRISKNFPGSDSKGHKHKKPKIPEKIRVPNGGIVLGGNVACTSNGHVAVAGEVNTESGGSAREVYMVKADEKAYKYEKASQIQMDNNMEAESSHPKEKTWEDTSSPGKKRGRLKLKKLPLSVCTFRDRENPKEEMITRTSPLTDKNMGNPPAGSSSIPLFSLERSSDGVMLPIEATPTWKCQEFKAPACVKQNKVVQS